MVIVLQSSFGGKRRDDCAEGAILKTISEQPFRPCAKLIFAAPIPQRLLTLPLP